MTGKTPTVVALARQLERHAKRGKIKGVVIACVTEEGKPHACWASDPFGSDLAALVGAASAAAGEIAWNIAAGNRAQWLYSEYLLRQRAREGRKRKRARR
jgi:hypothetical protein